MAQFGDNLGSGLGAKMQAFLDKTLLTNIVQNTFHDKMATMQKALPLKSSKDLEFRKWIRMQDLYLASNINAKFTGNVIDAAADKDEETLQNVPADEYKNFVLAEGSSGASKAKMKLIKSKATVFPIGDWMPYTEEMGMFHDKWTVAETAKQMGEFGGMIIDGYYRDLYVNGAGHVATVAAGKTVADPEFTKALRQTSVALRLSGAKPTSEFMSSSPNYGTIPVRSKYSLTMHTIACEGLRDNPDFVPVEKYRTSGTLENEVGIIGDFRVFEDPNSAITEKSSGVYTIKAIAGGRDHTAHVPIRGKGSTEFVFQALGSSGSSDALKRVGTVGWKSWLGAKVLYPERLAVVTVEVNF